jgi:molybdopterin-containing oxidoreductase family membrane subunit
MFSPTFVDIGFYRNNWFLLCIVLLYSRTFPVIAQAEIKTILKGTGDNYIRERAANKDLHHE